ncbi:hypothetical protein N5K35_24390 [Pseudomonas sp. GD03651]|jgi:hypothetical protein|uniref:Uncharacterized protein n=3 Tax=Pseudomonas TaxID=286 RepID=A0A1L7NEP6_PSEPU|nr:MULTISPECIES: hypothetical protein [Pseudomonas]MBP2082643.1 hypothetical protein [Pseudomonas sp. PvP089]MBP2091653.1 hypothetical protein [Pseudomonas sp. PvP088]MBP2222184.1 hypothetical protein [Pseudomonas putida]MCE0964475.1 hypothetical protein [Pseudomonas sp. NMI4491_12]MDH2186830.1 hypothetical protein [Pseudomonas sp. GD03651]
MLPLCYYRATDSRPCSRWGCDHKAGSRFAKIAAFPLGDRILTQAICSLLEDPMNKLILPFAIFVSVLLTGKIAEHYGLEGSWKIGLLCLVAAAVQIAVTRFQRYQRHKAQL